MELASSSSVELAPSFASPSLCLADGPFPFKLFSLSFSCLGFFFFFESLAFDSPASELFLSVFYQTHCFASICFHQCTEVPPSWPSFFLSDQAFLRRLIANKLLAQSN